MRIATQRGHRCPCLQKVDVASKPMMQYQYQYSYMYIAMYSYIAGIAVAMYYTYLLLYIV